MHLDIDSTSVWNSNVGMQHYSSTRNSIIWCFVDGGRKHCFRHHSSISHKCSIGLRSGDWDGHGIWFTLFSCSSNYSVTTRALWMGALSSYGAIAMIAKIMACPTFLYMTLSMMVIVLLTQGVVTCVAPAFNILCVPHLLKWFHYFGSYLYMHIYIMCRD